MDQAEKNYSIKKGFGTLYLADRSSTDFHLSRDDYFASLATIISLVAQDQALSQENDLKMVLKNISQDLLYLQDNFSIVKKKKPQKN